MGFGLGKYAYLITIIVKKYIDVWSIRNIQVMLYYLLKIIFDRKKDDLIRAIANRCFILNTGIF
jgi:hypothetical protein